MRRLSLGTLLISVNLALVLLAVLCIAAASASLLRRFANQQAHSRATQAGASALRILESAGQDLSAAAGMVAKETTLPRLLAARDRWGTENLLIRFCHARETSGCAVVLKGRRLASTGMATLPWEEIARGCAGSQEARMLRPAGAGPLLYGAAADVPGLPGATIITALLMDEALARSVGRQLGLPVAILDRTAAQEWNARGAAARGRAVDTGQPATERLEAGPYLAVVPLRDPSGEVIGIIETEMEGADLAAPFRRLGRALLILAIIVAGAAALLSVLLGWLLVRPLEGLTAASARIGLGDLATPIPRAPGAEIGALADTMEEMRRRLLHLTEALRQRQSEAEAVVTGIVEGVFAVDRERRIRFLNPQAAALLGTTPEQALGRFCGDVLNPQGADGVRPCEERCPIIHARYRGSARALERLLLPDGSWRSVVITSAGDPGPVGAEGMGSALAVRQFQVIRDETDIEATRRLRDSVLANITHEFRTPLSAQLASLELLRDRLGELSAAEVRDLVASLERGTLRLTHLIDNLLESVRIDAGQDSIRRQMVSLNEVIREALDLTSSLVALRDQRLDVRLPERLPRILGDGPRLVQVFVNLLANANKFAPAGTTIRIGGSVIDHEVEVWVEDEGPGILPRDGAVLFERFMRSPGEEPAESGMGLGLWIVKSIVDRHGGRVEARRGGGGRAGTRMCVVLPVAEGS